MPGALADELFYLDPVQGRGYNRPLETGFRGVWEGEGAITGVESSQRVIGYFHIGVFKSSNLVVRRASITLVYYFYFDFFSNAPTRPTKIFAFQPRLALIATEKQLH